MPSLGWYLPAPQVWHEGQCAPLRSPLPGRGGLEATPISEAYYPLVDRLGRPIDRGRGLEGDGLVGNAGAAFHRVVDALGAQAGLSPHDARRHAVWGALGAGAPLRVVKNLQIGFRLF